METIVVPSGTVAHDVLVPDVAVETTVLTVTENGVGKRTAASAWRTQRRGGKGVVGMKIMEGSGKVVGSVACRNDDFIMLTTANGVTIKMSAGNIRITGRTAVGVRLIRLAEDDEVVSVIKI